MLQTPVVTKVSVLPLIVHTPVVALVKVTGKVELAVAISVGEVPKFWLPGLLKVMLCVAFGVTAVEAVDAVPVPALFVALTVKVYAVPLVRPVTLIGLAAPPKVAPVSTTVTV